MSDSIKLRAHKSTSLRKLYRLITRLWRDAGPRELDELVSGPQGNSSLLEDGPVAGSQQKFELRFPISVDVDEAEARRWQELKRNLRELSSLILQPQASGGTGNFTLASLRGQLE